MLLSCLKYIHSSSSSLTFFWWTWARNLFVWFTSHDSRDGATSLRGVGVVGVVVWGWGGAKCASALTGAESPATWLVPLCTSALKTRAQLKESISSASYRSDIDSASRLSILWWILPPLLCSTGVVNVTITYPLSPVPTAEPWLKVRFCCFIGCFIWTLQVLIDWINDVLVGERIIVKDLAEDLYDGQVLQKLFGKTSTSLVLHHQHEAVKSLLSHVLRSGLRNINPCAGLNLQKSWKVRNWTWPRWPSPRSPKNRSCRRSWNASTTPLNFPPGTFAGTLTVRTPPGLIASFFNLI